MNILKFYRHLLMGLLVAVIGLSAQAQKIRVQVTGIQSTDGKIVLSVFKNNETFKEENPFKKWAFAKQGIVNGAIALDITLEPGTYGFALLDDANADGKMDKSMIGMPKEGFGFSNFFLKKMKRPAFDDFKIVVKPGENKVTMKVKYL